MLALSASFISPLRIRVLFVLSSACGRLSPESFMFEPLLRGRSFSKLKTLELVWNTRKLDLLAAAFQVSKTPYQYSWSQQSGKEPSNVWRVKLIRIARPLANRSGVSSDVLNGDQGRDIRWPDSGHLVWVSQQVSQCYL